MKRLARGSWFVLVTIGLASACGGKSKGADRPRATGSFDKAAVKAALTTTKLANLEGCSAEGAATIGDLVAAQRTAMAIDGAVDESFECRASALVDGQHECTWQLIQRTSAEAADDPCGGGGAAYQVIVQANHDSTLVPSQITCIAPG